MAVIRHIFAFGFSQFPRAQYQQRVVRLDRFRSGRLSLRPLAGAEDQRAPAAASLSKDVPVGYAVAVSGAQGATGTSAPKPKLLDQVRDAIRARHMSPRTEEAYAHWIKRYILYHHKRHPAEMGPAEITQFLTALAVERHVSASTQNQALAALLFLYREVYGRDPGWLDGPCGRNGRSGCLWS